MVEHGDNSCLSCRLALFFHTPFFVRILMTLSIRDTCRSNRSRRNWVCLAQSTPGTADLRIGRAAEIGFVRTTGSAGGTGGLADPCPFRARPEIGFVFPSLLASRMCHNSFPANHLPVALPWPRLGLFGAAGWFVAMSSPRRRGDARCSVAWASCPCVGSGPHRLCSAGASPSQYHGRPGRDPEIGFVCTTMLHRLLATDYRPIGFVFLRPLPHPTCHNSLSTRHLLSKSLPINLALFGAKAHGTGAEGGRATPYRHLASFCTNGLRPRLKCEVRRGGPPWPPAQWAGTGACPYTLETPSPNT